MLTEYHAKLYAHELMQRCSMEKVGRLTNALLDAQVELNPHQIDAALFAFQSPPMRGAILADEVGLGKTIEAGIVLSQHWAERKRKILIILPANLRKQWSQELQEKFYLPSTILETASFNKEIKNGNSNPFDTDKIILCSYQFARNKSASIQQVQWDLAVVDEAHRLRNVYQKNNKIASELRRMLGKTPKLLLTATPLQNTLKELFGLASFIDEHIFGDIKSFQSQFGNSPSEAQLKDLRERLTPICKRTLRKQVLEYIKFTARKPYTQKFTPTTAENMLYDQISEYLRRTDLQALPSGQRQLITLVLRKQLASSTFAIAGSMENIANRLQKRLVPVNQTQPEESDDEIESDVDGIDELADELEEELNTENENDAEQLSDEQRTLIEKEIAELREFHRTASGIKENAKGIALLQALEVGFKMTQENKAVQKAIIFTESKRTQKYILELLRKNGYTDDIVLFNGSNSEPEVRVIYNEWKTRHQGTDKITGSATADTRAALVEYFRDKAKIMIATEAAAEGINLQFCSMVVNYDLPWNPQRIEQRIGRCHRYGQKHDVVVINFLNENNAADRRAFQLLEQKFRLFDGVFGSSDEVLGSIENGFDFEKRCHDIFQTCRTDAEIDESFDRLQEEMGEKIDQSLQETRQKLLENFDTEVADKLGVLHQETEVAVNRNEKLLWDLTRYALDGKATFDERDLSFQLLESMTREIPQGRYCFKNLKKRDIQDEISGFHYRTQHPLAQWVLEQTRRGILPDATLTFTLDRKISALDKFVGKSGLFFACRLWIQSIHEEERVILAAVDSDGNALDTDETKWFFELPATVEKTDKIHIQTNSSLYKIYENKRDAILEMISRKDAEFLDTESDKLDRWVEDRRLSLKAQLDELSEEIKSKKKENKAASDVQEKIRIKRQLKEIEARRDAAWKQYDNDYRQIENQRDQLLEEVESQVNRKREEETLFTIRWNLIKE